MADIRASLNGAVDLSYLKQSQPEPTGEQTSNFAVPALVVDANASNIRELLSVSSAVPVLVYFHTTRAEASTAMLAELERLTLAANGKTLLVRVDADNETELVQALGVTGLPSLVAVLKGQPAPIFAATVEVAQLGAVFEKLLQVAASNGLNQTLTVSENAPAAAPAPAAKPISQNLQAGYEAMEQGDFDKAIAAFESELNSNPSADEPKLAIEQARFLQRLAGIDLDAVLAAGERETIEKVLVLADAKFAAVAAADAFDLLLEQFVEAKQADRDLIRARLISYFALAGNEDPAVASARVRLANLLF
jgi:putative thioredoxin